MRLDPVYLVGPKPAAPSMPTRRAFVFAGSTFAVGLSLGGACGYAMGAGAAPVGTAPPQEPAPAAPAAPDEIELKPSGDADLDELRRLAVKAPIDELMEQRMMFVNATFMDYPTDAILWRGVERIAVHLIGGGLITDRRQFGRALASVIEKADPAIVGDLRRHAPALRRLR